jgi:hypothetical protein
MTRASTILEKLRRRLRSQNKATSSLSNKAQDLALPSDNPPKATEGAATHQLQGSSSPESQSEGETDHASLDCANRQSKRLASPDESATSDEDGNLWLRAENLLYEDSTKKKIWHAFLEILQSELGSELKSSGTNERHLQLCQILDKKTQELQQKRWRVRFGEHEVQPRDLLMDVFKLVLFAKEPINSIARSTPPIAMTFAGLITALTVG